MNLFYLWVVTKTLLCGCTPDRKRYDFGKVRSKYTIDKIAFLPQQINESSGLARASDGHSFWTHNDGGGPPELYRVGLDGTLKEVIKFRTIGNRDWEDLASGADGRLWIGDFGNNNNARKDLKIYILPPAWEKALEEDEIGTITFRYGRQTVFPEHAGHRNYDCEAFFYHDGHLYLFSKNTGRKPRYTTLYKMPAEAGDYTLQPVDSIRLNETVTGADISPDGKQFALLSYGKIFFFEVNGGNIDFSKPAYCLKKYRGQTEAILYQDPDRMLITNEKGRVLGLLAK